jgi:hypothetical protein
MPDGHTWRRSQREIREGRAPRRLAERRDLQPRHHSRRCSGAAYLARRLALAVSVVLLVIASTVVHSDDYGPASGPYVDFGHPDDSFQISGSGGVCHVSMAGFSPAVLGIIPIDPIDPVELVGKAGHYFYDLDTRVDFSSGPFLESRHSRSDFLYGGGLGVTLFRHLNVRAKYERVDVT